MIISRRTALAQLGLTGLGSVCIPALLRSEVLKGGKAVSHPHIYWTRNSIRGLRSVEDVRSSVIRDGLSRSIWEAIKDECDNELGTAPLNCRSPISGRSASSLRANNPDYYVCHAAGHRLLRHAIALHLTGDEVYKKAALEQLAALFDESVWPDWIDQAHLRFDLPADLRTGMLSQDAALAYDWLHPFLDEGERSFILEGIGRRGIQPYLQSMEADPWWSKDLNNWYTVIIGGLGIAGMALGEDHPDAEILVEMSLPKMHRYLSIYGDDGSFNESVAYSNATRIPVAYFFALYYHRAGGNNPIARHPFPQTAEWTMHATLPPGRFAAFGDGHAEAPVDTAFMTAIAAATRNPVIQGYAIRHTGIRANPYELLWLDENLVGSSPESKLPLGKAFNDNGALLFSRSSWHPEEPEMIVYGKAKRAHNHAHNDLGQVCIDVMGKRMITDPGSPSSYPPDFFDEARYRYYNASVRGHNVVMFGGREQRHPPQDRGVKEAIDFESFNGRILKAEFDDTKGSLWQIDLTRAYNGVNFVRRTVIHLIPGWVAVLDEAELEKVEPISLRWHTIHPAVPDEKGNFMVQNGKARLACHVEALSGKESSFGMRRHAYQAPYDRDRTGDPLEQRHEPFVEIVMKDRTCRILTLFASHPVADKGEWIRAGSTWSWKNQRSAGEVTCTEEILRVRSTQGQAGQMLGQILVQL